VRKLDWRGEFRFAWQGEVLERSAEHLLLLAVWRGPGEPVVGEMTFMFGDRFLEHYYPGRGYAIWQIEGATGNLKGWYCNISTPVVETDGVLSFEDLLLDVVAYPDGRYAVLDRDEFEDARRHDLSAERCRLAEAALRQVLGLIQAAAPPFAFTGAPRPIDRM
jgi:predicted RNA-binding protein associated with RNAse of E/G family